MNASAGLPAPDETIVAPATPVGRSALAIVRIDGPEARLILQKLSGRALPEERVATLMDIRHSGDDLDECMAIMYAAPRSFTGNDLVELTLHGNPLIVRRVIEACVDLGARIAEPGEFTERAVLNGKLDLVQAESIADLVNARTALQAKLSLHNVEGLLSRRATAIRDELLRVISRLEAALDFSEEGYEFIGHEEAERRIRGARAEVEAIAESYRRGRATQAGLSAVILGRPNAGKSTLLNRLVGSDRAIVTPVPGTTRDIVRETIEIGGLPVTFADTAGLRESSDLVEGIGINLARDAARNADLILYLVDGVSGLTDEDRAELGRLGSRIRGRREVDVHAETPIAESQILIIWTKRDLAAPPADALSISASTGDGMTELMAKLDDLVRARFAAPESSPTIVNERQRAAIVECSASLGRALQSIESGAEEQLIVVDLYAASNALAALTGAITREDVLQEIFAKFCIGK